VISAIISNALKFSLDGGVVSVLLRRSDADDGTAVARLAVSDTGVGVPEGEQERSGGHQERRGTEWTH